MIAAAAVVPNNVDSTRYATSPPTCSAIRRRRGFLRSGKRRRGERPSATRRYRQAATLNSVQRSQDRLRIATRQARRAAAVSLSETAERCGIAEKDLRAALAALPGRGACAQAVATAAASGVAAAGCVSQCPPPAARAAGFAAAGTQSWSSDLGVAAAADSDVPVARGLARRALCAAVLCKRTRGTQCRCIESGLFCVDARRVGWRRSLGGAAGCVAAPPTARRLLWLL